MLLWTNKPYLPGLFNLCLGEVTAKLENLLSTHDVPVRIELLEPSCIGNILCGKHYAVLAVVANDERNPEEEPAAEGLTRRQIIEGIT